jgi:hypothetical protein
MPLFGKIISKKEKLQVFRIDSRTCEFNSPASDDGELDVHDPMTVWRAIFYVIPGMRKHNFIDNYLHLKILRNIT